MTKERKQPKGKKGSRRAGAAKTVVAVTRAVPASAEGPARKRLVRSKLFLAVIATVLSLLALEVGFRVYYYFAGVTTNITFGATSEEWRRLWIERHREKGVDVYHGYNRYDEQLGWGLKPKLNAFEVAGYPPVSTNAQGWRASRDFVVDKPANVTRIVAVGDSLTFGEGVANRDTWPAQLELQLDQSEVFNFAVGGYGTDQQLLTLEQYAIEYSPDIVIVGFFVEDIARNGLAFRDYAKPKFVLDDGGLRVTNTPVPSFDQILDTDTGERPWSYLGHFVSSRMQGLSGLEDLATSEELLALGKALLLRMQAAAKRAGAKLLVVSMPSQRWPKDTEAALQAWAPGVGYAFLNLRQSLVAGQATYKKTMLLDAVHLSPIGNLVAAVAIREKLEALGWTKPHSEQAQRRLNQRAQEHR